MVRTDRAEAAGMSVTDVVQTLAVTATATAAVIEDIRQSLRMRPSDAVFKETFDRPNLSYSVHVKTSMTEDLKQVSAPSTKHTAHVLPISCIADASAYILYRKASGGTMKIPGQRPKPSTSHSSTELRGRTHTHGTDTTPTTRHTHTGLTHSRAMRCTSPDFA